MIGKRAIAFPKLQLFLAAAALVLAAVLFRPSRSALSAVSVFAAIGFYSAAIRVREETGKLLLIEERTALGRDAQVLLLKLNGVCDERLLLSVTKETVVLLATLNGQKLSLAAACCSRCIGCSGRQRGEGA